MLLELPFCSAAVYVCFFVAVVVLTVGNMYATQINRLKTLDEPLNDQLRFFCDGDWALTRMES